MDTSYICSRCSSAMVFLCGQLFLYFSRNILPNCSKPRIDPLGSWLNQFNGRLVNVVEKSLQVNLSVTSSSKILCLNCKRWEIGYVFLSNLSRTDGLNSLSFTSHIIQGAKGDLKTPFMVSKALSFTLCIGFLPILFATSSFNLSLNSPKLTTFFFSSIFWMFYLHAARR